MSDYSLMMACEAQGGPTPPPAIITRLVAYLEQGSMEEELNAFLEEHTDHAGRREAETGEYSLESQDLYRRFVSMVEDSMKDFLELEDLTDKDLKTVCEQALQDDCTNATSKFLEAWISSWEFESFMELLEDFRLEKLQDWSDEEEAKGGAKDSESKDGDEGESKWGHK
jgi:hypothetical protein